MDPLSHALLGATTAVAACRKRTMIRAAAICGIMGGMAPDLDIVIRAANNPMFGLGMHRHFTHSLFFAPIGSLLVALAVWLLLRKRVHYISIYAFTLLGMIMHGPLDAATNYGTHLFWPFTERRESWNLISIIDPIFTLTLFGLLFVAIRKQTATLARIGLAFALFYLSFGAWQKHTVEAALHALATSRGHNIERMEVKPSFANLIVWRGHYQSEDRFYIDAYRTTPFSDVKTYEGSSVATFQPPANLSPTQAKDVAFSTFFSDGWVAYAPNHPDVIADMRFSTLPNESNPLWGIRLKPEQSQSHVDFVSLRSRRSGDVAKLWDMVLGK